MAINTFYLHKIANIKKNFQLLFAEESKNLLLWTPFLISLGIAAFFSYGYYIIWQFLFITLLAFFLFLYRPLRKLSIIFIIISLGYGASYLRTQIVYSPFVQGRIGPVLILGKIRQIEPRERDHRLYLGNLSIPNLPLEKTPSQIRINTKDKQRSALRIGDLIIARAELMEPPLSTYPGGFDIRRFFYFKKIGAIGYTVGKIKIIDKQESIYWQNKINELNKNDDYFVDSGDDHKDENRNREGKEAIEKKNRENHNSLQKNYNSLQKNSSTTKNIQSITSPLANQYSFANLEFLQKISQHFQQIINSIRQRISLKIKASLQQPYSSIVNAMLIGETTEITSASANVLRSAGTAHIVAISGLHVVSVAGVVFFIVNRFNRSFSWIALRYGSERFAAAISIIAIFLYLLIAGSPVSAQRAVGTSTIFFIALIIGRDFDALRALALVASLIILLTPENLFSPGLQMSFSASVALITTFKFLKKWENKRHFGAFNDRKDKISKNISGNIENNNIFLFLLKNFINKVRKKLTEYHNKTVNLTLIKSTDGDRQLIYHNHSSILISSVIEEDNIFEGKRDIEKWQHLSSTRFIFDYYNQKIFQKIKECCSKKFLFVNIQTQKIILFFLIIINKGAKILLINYKTLLHNLRDLIISSLAASLATAPFVAYHFHQASFYSVLANLICVPLTNLFVMPLGIISLLLIPFNLQFIALLPMSWGIEIILQVSEFITKMPGSTIFLPYVSDIFIILFSVGFYGICVSYNSFFRFFSLIIMFLSFIYAIFAEKDVIPDIIISGGGRLYAIKNKLLCLGENNNSSEKFFLSSKQSERYTRSTWIQTIGPSQFHNKSIQSMKFANCNAEKCDICYLRHNIGRINLKYKNNIFGEEKKEIILNNAILELKKETILTQKDLQQSGTHIIFISNEKNKEEDEIIIKIRKVYIKKENNLPWEPY